MLCCVSVRIKLLAFDRHVDRLSILDRLLNHLVKQKAIQSKDMCHMITKDKDYTQARELSDPL